MRYLDVVVGHPVAYLIPIGDVHIGDKAFRQQGLAKLKGYLDWCRGRPEARIFLLGDIFNVGGRLSKTSPFETDTQEYEHAIDIFSPHASRIWGAVDGNHEHRPKDMFGFSPTESLCRELKVPYCGDSALIRLRVGPLGRSSQRGRYAQQYFLYAHHTTSGGAQNPLAGVSKLELICPGCDVYLGGHNHRLATETRNVYLPTAHGPQEHKITFVSCGSYMEWGDSYMERATFRVPKLGSPRIRFDGRRSDADHGGRHDVHVSI